MAPVFVSEQNIGLRHFDLIICAFPQPSPLRRINDARAESSYGNEIATL
jgi:hypothetical protein